MVDDQNDVFKALADPTRRKILDLLRMKDWYNTNELCVHFPEISRIAVMKHLKKLIDANLVFDKYQGREHKYRLNVIPLEQMYNRWMKPYEKIWASSLTNLKDLLERNGE